MNKDELTLFNDLKREGVEAQKHNQVRFNSGSETARHVVAKSLVAHIASQMGWRVSSEVSVPEGEIDILLHKTPQQRVWAVELETDPTELVNDSKVDRYCRNEPMVDDIAIINISEMPEDIPFAEQYLREMLPL